MSDILVDFADPVLKVLPDDADLHDYRRALDFAAQIWNACVMLQHDNPDLRTDAREGLDRLLGVGASPAQSPPPEARALLLSLLERKRERFASERRIIAAVDAELRGDRVHVTALSSFA